MTTTTRPDAKIWNDLDRAGRTARPIAQLFEGSGGSGAGGDARAGDFSVRALDMLFDYSKTAIDPAARDLLLELVAVHDLAGRREAMFTGERINRTEDRAVLHPALRNPDREGVQVDGQDVMAEVHETLDRMEAFARDVRAGRIAGQGGAYTDVVNIGIGGSDLGPVMATLALAPYHDGPRVHYVSNVDGAHLADTLRGLDPTRTLVIVASKTFTTIETMTNARSAREWMAGKVDDPASQFAALSSATDKTGEFGIDPSRVFGFEDWVGGRYSVWGPIGLPVMLAIGPQDFRAFLSGGHAMDRHFREAPAKDNMPVMLALVGMWHHQVMGYPTRAVLPYEQRLLRLPAYLQQLEMESNGKRVTMEGAALDMVSGPVVWGEPGTNGQHAFYQLIHQGTTPVPCEFMVARKGFEPELANHHDLLIANCLAQSEALMLGRDLDTARALMRKAGHEGAALEMQAAHRVFPGNRPSTTLLYPQLTPQVLGQIIALYEHRVFVEGVILGINSFDQWGVELGKELATALLPMVEGADASSKDGSTRALLDYLRG
ncbi:glucose-6-phosphate isomerase [Loktanella sp. 22II-4b]|uniref:glucose-6-phosphate isomerase n=1 Tax=Brevirhabdus pacifica TaxID=1267768 RepID=UPI0009FB226F|nr:glucose-6-phosphate isomerase [Brevirhabdus pacifica]OWU79813.1 glucose-6-phosphate isomerase [Loktanella sp. 22II-4b]PJJ87007.1 glucose-6-phosphate isomerase [Brevirhabdus pacifica]